MVVSANLQPWARVDIVIKGLDDATQTKTLQFTNRPCQQGDATYLPLLKSYSGLSLSVGQDGLPNSGSGSIVINDQWESLGENRRVFDYFDRYTPINQTVTVYRGINTLGDLTLPSWTAIYTGKVESVSKSKNELTFSVSNSLVESKIATAVITADLASTGFEVPTQSLGKPLPIVFTNQSAILPAYSLDWAENTGGVAKYAYATNIGSAFTVAPSTLGCYVKDTDGVYRSVYVNGLYDEFPIGAPTTVPGVNYPTPNGLNEYLITFETGGIGSDGIILTGLSWWCKGQNNVAITPVGTINFTIYRSPSTALNYDGMTDWEEIATFDVNKADYLTQVRGASDFYVNCDFDNGVVLGGVGIDADVNYSIYAIGVRLSNYTGSSSTDFTSGGSFITGGDLYFYRSTKGGPPTVGTGTTPLIYLKASLTESLASASLNEKGLGYSYVRITPKVTTCKVSELDVAVSINKGLLDDVSGSVTGTPSAAIYYPHHVAKLLDYAYDGTVWAASGIIDTTTFSSLYTIFSSGSYQRSISGFTEGNSSWLDLLSQIAKEMCCALVPLSNGKIALWPWGNTGSVVRTFTDADIIEIGNIEETDPSTVINNIRIEYGKNFTQVFDQWEASGKASNISGVVVVNKSTNPILTNSESLYGKRELEESGTQFIGDVTTATTRALYYILRHEHTHRTFNITVSYFDNTDLKLMDVIDVLSVHGPSYFGSSGKGRPITYTGTEVDIWKGEYIKEATRRRVQIIGLNNDYDGDFPKLVITCREIKPRHKNDPTAANL